MGVGRSLASTRGALVAITMAAWAHAAGASDRPVIDPDVRALDDGGTLRVLVELRVARPDPAAITATQDEILRRLAGTGVRLVRRYTTAPLLALEIDAAALVRLEEMSALVRRVRKDKITLPDEGPDPRR